MKKLILLAFVLVSVSVQAQTSARTIVETFLLPTEGKVFRGFDFDSMEDEIQPKEEARYNVDTVFADVDTFGNMWLAYDVYADDINYIELDYYLDFYGMAEVYANIYTETSDLATEVFNQLNSYYTGKCGAGGLYEDGYTYFNCSYNDYNYSVWMKELEDSFGKYVSFELYLEE
ncbi:MAG: hypothetical protein LRY27_03025 [Chitinophagales bacterium]|nr:hypothetical protein [Chitinophagales bacterium]